FLWSRPKCLPEPGSVGQGWPIEGEPSHGWRVRPIPAEAGIWGNRNEAEAAERNRDRPGTTARLAPLCGIPTARCCVFFSAGRSFLRGGFAPGPALLRGGQYSGRLLIGISHRSSMMQLPHFGLRATQV